jgi:hypothetical protein
MILVRDIFQLKFGMAREARELWKEGMAIAARHNLPTGRMLTDLVGPAYTLVLEITYASLAEYESTMNSALGAEDWKEWYPRFVPLAESSRREIFTIVEE